MIKAIALDDEILALKVIEAYAERIDYLSLEKTFNAVGEAQKYLKKFPVDLIFLDIQMPAQNGLAFYKTIDQNTKVIFTTAYTDYAVDAFEVNAVDYLVKPFAFDRFKNAVEKVRNQTHEQENQTLTVRADYKLLHIRLEEILLIEGLDDYVQIHTVGKGKITTRSSMKALIEKLPPKEFIRVHRSYIIPVKNIRSVVNKSINLGDFVIPVGDTYREEIAKILKI
ncbi:LytR/AlgR family response regulator transcription factor [Bergeyella sp. RCAD1439]|uniref:LytR/AlgR family response regulator transcription factor n=1 Tax=Bergeyella anatis TaxID=3113737 RepID=UPI002E16F1E6|nr:LytTR family DNA-binding domain-containing protein [Bergeyella sp. RCAD1439]